MTINRNYRRISVRVLIILIKATILAIILSFIIIEFVNLELLIKILLFPEEMSIPIPYNYFGLILIIVGAFLIIWANYALLFIGKIGLDAKEPFQTPSTLVVDGPYRFSRNPIYLSLIIISIGLAILLSSLTFSIMAIVVFFIFRTWFIIWEEKKLEETFGEEYLEYKNRVRRWI